MVRFRLTTDSSVTAAGWHVDDIRLLGAGPSCVAESAPTADFASSSPDLLGESTSFLNGSTGGNLSYVWDFGDGSPTSTEINPLHQYALAGIYTVTLSVTNSIGSDVAGGTVEIVEPLNSFLPLVQSSSAAILNQRFGYEENLGRK